MKSILYMFVILMLFSSCNDGTKSQVNNQSQHQVIVQEVLHVKEYSYIRVLDAGTEKWIAAPSTPLEVGKTYYVGKEMLMQNFESKDLNRTFETIYFVEKISASAEAVDQSLTTNSRQLNSEATKPVIEKKNVKVSAGANTISIAELFENSTLYKNKVVKLKGEVTKYNPAIMNVNWFHMQDGTDFGGEFDLTVTTAAEVQIGDIVTLEGTVTLNKDFGAGYYYAIIIENAVLVK